MCGGGDMKKRNGGKRESRGGDMKKRNGGKRESRGGKEGESLQYGVMREK